jgi:hypothetical protein
MHYAFFLKRQLLLFLIFLCFVSCNKCLDHIMCLERDMLHFSFAKNTPFFSLYVSTSVLFFLLLRLACIFRLDFCSDLAISLHQSVFGPLVHVGIYQKSFVKKVWMVLEKGKSFMQKNGTRRSLCRLWPRLLHVMLDVFLIVCLVVLL